MQLVVSRKQADVKGVFGGHKGVSFTLEYRLELTSEERQLVDRYRLLEYPLTFRTVQGATVPDDTVGNLLAGRAQTVSDVTTLIRNEETIKSACDSLPPLFEVARTFGGHEVIEYPRVEA